MISRNKFSKYIQSLTLGKILIIASAVITFLSLSLLGYSLVREGSVSVRDVRVTNVTGTGATITWISDSPSKGSIIYSKDDFWVPVFNHIGKKRAYDDRDIKEVEYGVYALDKWNEYYVHHVTLRNLEPNMRYYYKISTGLKSIDIEYPSLETTDILDDVFLPPYPVYGRVINSNEQAQDDTLVFLKLEGFYPDAEVEVQSQVLSTVTSDSSGWSIDISTVRKQDLGDLFDRNGTFSVVLDVYSRDHVYESIVADSDKLQPVEDIIIFNTESEENVSLDQSLVVDVSAECWNECKSLSAFKDGCRNGEPSPGAWGCDGKTQADWEAWKAANPQLCECGGGGGEEDEGEEEPPEEGEEDAGEEEPTPTGNCGKPENYHNASSWECRNGTLWYLNTDTEAWEDSGIRNWCGSNCPVYSNVACEQCEESCTCGGTAENESSPATTPGGDSSESTSPGVLLCGQSDTRSHCVAQFGESGCNVLPGEQCTIEGGIVNCVYGYTCSNTGDVCERDSSISCKQISQEMTIDTTCYVGQNNWSSLSTSDQNVINQNLGNKGSMGYLESKTFRDGANNSFKIACNFDQIKEEMYWSVTPISYGDTTCSSIGLQEGQIRSVNGLVYVCSNGKAHVVETDPDYIQNPLHYLSACQTLHDELVEYPQDSGVFYDCSNGAFEANTIVVESVQVSDSCVQIHGEADCGDECNCLFPQGCNQDLGEACAFKKYDQFNCPFTLDPRSSLVNQEISNCKYGYDCLGNPPVCTGQTRQDLERDTDGDGKPDRVDRSPDDPCSPWPVTSIDMDHNGLPDHYSTDLTRTERVYVNGVLCDPEFDSSKVQDVGVAPSTSSRSPGTSATSPTDPKNFTCYYYCNDAYGAFGVSLNPAKIGSVADSVNIAYQEGEWCHINVWKGETKDTDAVSPLCVCQIRCGRLDDFENNGKTCSEICNERSANNINFNKKILGAVYASEEDVSAELEITTDTLRLTPSSTIFWDANKNGVKDDDEINVTLEDIKDRSISNGAFIELKEGWNLIHIPMYTDVDQGSKVTTAKKLLDEINEQGLYATHVGSYKSGAWMMYTQRAGVSYSDDFEIVPGQGYFVRVHIPGTVLFRGRRFAESVPLDLEIGWNLVGIVAPEKEYTAERLIDTAIEQEIQADIVTRWDGKYENLIKEEGVTYGSDFTLFDVGGYFVRVSSDGGRFTP